MNASAASHPPLHPPLQPPLHPPLRLGVVSTAAIGLKKVIPAMIASPHLQVLGIASRQLDVAQAAADALGIPQAYGSYEALLADPQIEAIYNPLPNHLHVPVSLAAAQAGKHVLCEKPFALKAADLDVLRPFADRVHIVEAFMVRHHPQWIEARDRLRAGAIGELRFMQVAFCYFNDNPGNIRNQAEIGGGALYDIGCYAIVAGRWFFEREPLRAAALIDRDPRFRTDRTTTGLLDFGAGAQLAFTVSTQSAPYQRIQLVGSRGRIEIEIPFNAPPAAATRIWIDDGSTQDGSRREEITFPAVDQYTLQGEAFARRVRTSAPDVSGLDDAAANLRIIEALFASEASGLFEPVPNR
jgi:predicted dehydrogenase